MKEQFSTPSLIIIRGIPGSGKTSIAIGLAEALGNNKVQPIDPDEIDVTSDAYRAFSHSLSAQGIDEKFHTYRYLNTKARQAVDAHQVIIWNQAFIDFKGLSITIERLREYAHGQGNELPVLVVDVVIDPVVARQRISTRATQDGRVIDEEVMERFIQNYVPLDGKLYPSIIVHGTDPIQQSVTSIIGSLKT